MTSSLLAFTSEFQSVLERLERLEKENTYLKNRIRVLEEENESLGDQIDLVNARQLWEPVDFEDQEAFQLDSQYRIKIEGGGHNQWYYATSVQAGALTIRICQTEELGAILSHAKHEWVGYAKGNFGKVVSGPQEVYDMQRKNC